MTTCDLHYRTTKRVLFRFPYRDQWPTAADDLFETVRYQGNDEDWIRVYVSPVGGWRRTSVYLDEEPSVTYSSSTALLTTSRATRSFEGTSNETRIELYAMLMHLMQESIESNCDTYTPVLMHDCASPEHSDLVNALQNGGEPTTVRRGLLRIDEQGSIVGPPEGPYYLPAGFKFRFIDIQVRTV